MTLVGPAPALCTREDVAAALDVPASARTYATIDRHIATGTEAVHTLCRRARFYPEVRSLSFDWPTRQNASSWRLWLDDNDALSLSAVTTGGVLVDADGYRLGPVEYGPPYSCVELLLGTASRGWGGGSSHQGAIVLAGTWGYLDTTAPAGQLAASCSSSATTITVTDAAAVGVGDLLTIGAERLLVVDRRQVATGQQLAGALGGLLSATSLAVADGSQLHVGEQLLIDAERVTVEDVAGNTAVVTRAAAGSVLAAHLSGAAVYAPRQLVVERGALGTVAGAHTAGDVVARLAVPAQLRQLAIAESLVAAGREQSGYARTIGSGEGTRAAPAGDLRDLRDAVRARYGRSARFRAV